MSRLHRRPSSQHLGWAHRVHVRFAFAIAGLVVSIGTAQSQAVSGRPAERELTSATMRARCAANLAVLDTAAALKTVPPWRLDALGSCEHSGPNALGRLWLRVDSDRDRLLAMQNASRALPDMRLYTALSAIVRRNDRPAPVMRAIIDVLVGFAVPGAAPSPIVLTPEPQVALSSFPPITGIERPIDAEGRAYVAQVLRSLGTGDAMPMSKSPADAPPTTQEKGSTRTTRPTPGPLSTRSLADMSVEEYAETAARALDVVERVRVPHVPTGALRLTYLCGNRFRVRNSSNVPVRALLEVYRSNAPQVEVGAPAGGETTIDLEQRGTVRLLYRGVVYDTKANGRVTCR